MARLKQLLGEIGVRQRDLAAGLMLSESEVSRTVNGERDLSVGRALAILTFPNRPEHLARLGRTAPITFEELFSEAAA